MKKVTDCIFLGSKIIVDGDCIHEIKKQKKKQQQKKHLLLWPTAMTI